VIESAVAVIVPMYNEGAMVGEVVTELREHFPLVVCVDDGSSDDSAAVAHAAGAVVLVHRVNLGQGGALQTGFDFVRDRTSATHAVTFDADGQHLPSDALAMVARARETGANVVLGSRSLGSSVSASLGRTLLLKAAVRYSRWSSGLPLSDTHNGLRVLDRTALTRMRLRQPGMAHASELERLIVSHGLSWTEHPVSIRYTDYSRAKGQSNLNAFNIVYDLTLARLVSAT
jgi:glycosyltransferase involved in cell wall biosynthesis